ncbi:MAG: hypothetical protein MPW17_22995 (plasmid) [Candidatus Manganitrophus sp.]|nr:hypothetical protein [Candidatus Manganitrophus sp.]MDC4228253.1 hypothetical protein [Candidatus Manganitrophus sp.]WDT73490.1 MAG: hypothetical protein MPW17_22995 [Candidatus Manganitrophus sp.]
MQRYTGGLHSGLVTTIVLVILVLFGPKILQMGKPSEEGKNPQTPASVVEPDNREPQTKSEEPKAAMQSSSPESSDQSPGGVPADCSKAMSSLTQTGTNEPDRSVYDPTANSDASSLDRQEPLSLSSIESEDGTFEPQQKAPPKNDEAKNKVQSDQEASC